MSWSGLANNQCVSGNNLNDAVSTGVFNAKTSIPYTNKELNAYEAFSYVNIYDTGKPVNQLVVKSNLTAQQTNPSNPVYYFRMYGIALNGSGIYYPVVSVNGGVTFSQFAGSVPNYYYSSIAGSADGRIIAIGSLFGYPNDYNIFYLSTNYGVTFNRIQLPNGGTAFFDNYQIQDIDMSSDGRVIAVLIATDGSTAAYITASVSTDYGASFTTYPTFKQSYAVGKIAVSGNGTYVQYVGANFFGNFSWRVYSSNSGASFTITSNSINQIFSDICMSETGQYQLVVNQGTASTGNLFISSNYGSTFPSKSTYGGGRSCAMESSGASMTVMKSKNQIAFSQNYGNNWTAKTIGNDTAYGITSGDYPTPSYPYAYTAIAIDNGYNVGYINYSQTNSFLNTYTQQVTYNVTIIRVFKKSFRI